MNFEKDFNQQEDINNDLADKLDELYKEFIKEHKSEPLPYVEWIIDDLRKGDLKAAKINYEQQRDKYDNKPEIRKFLEENNIVDKGIDWSAWKNID